LKVKLSLQHDKALPLGTSQIAEKEPNYKKGMQWNAGCGEKLRVAQNTPNKNRETFCTYLSKVQFPIKPGTDIEV
jgi:hypothetical protein